MTDHVATKHKLKDIPLVSDIECILKSVNITDDERDMMRMIYIAGNDLRFIGDELGWSERTVKSHHKSVLRKIAKVI